MRRGFKATKQAGAIVRFSIATIDDKVRVSARTELDNTVQLFSVQLNLQDARHLSDLLWQAVGELIPPEEDDSPF